MKTIRKSIAIVFIAIGVLWTLAWGSCAISSGISDMLQVQIIGKQYSKSHPHENILLSKYWPGHGDTSNVFGVFQIGAIPGGLITMGFLVSSIALFYGGIKIYPELKDW